MNKERLQLVIDAVEGVTGNQFDMGTWRYYAGSECGTVGCAGGWAAVYPPCRELGLQLVPPGRDSWDLVYEGHHGYSAMGHFLQASGDPESIYHLFSAAEYSRLTGEDARQEFLKRAREYLK